MIHWLDTALRSRNSMVEISDHSLLTFGLRPDSIVLDLGANNGVFSTAMKERFGCRCYAVEANPKLIARLETMGYAGLLHAAATGQSGEVLFNSADCDLQSRVVSKVDAADSAIRVRGLNYAEILRHFDLAEVDVLKVDIEGAELALIDAMSDAQLLAVGQMTIEFHDFVPLYPRSEVNRILKRLRSLGFRNFSPNYGTYDVLLVNCQRVTEVSQWNAMFATVFTRPTLRVLRPILRNSEASTAARTLATD